MTDRPAGCDVVKRVPIIEAVTVTLYRVVNRPKGWRKGKPRRQKALAYRDAAWAKLRTRCQCTFPMNENDPPRKVCRYHDKEYRVENPRVHAPWDDPPSFDPPEAWGLPRSREAGYWDYGRAVAFRLARLYRYLDAKAGDPVPSHAVGLPLVGRDAPSTSLLKSASSGPAAPSSREGGDEG